MDTERKRDRERERESDALGLCGSKKEKIESLFLVHASLGSTCDAVSVTLVW